MSAEILTEGRDAPVWRGARRRPPRRWWPALLAIGAAVGVLAILLSAVVAWPTTYAATTIVSFTPRPDAIASADVMQVIGQKYVVIATSGAMMQVAAGPAGLDADTLTTSTTVTLSAGTGNIDITVVRPDRAQAVRAANALATLLVERSAADALTTSEVTSAALVSRAEVKPARALLSAVSVAAAAVVGVLVWCVLTGRSKNRSELST